MQEIKATSVIPTMEYVMYDLGKDVYKDVLARLSDSQRPIFKKRMLPANWVSLKDFIAFNQAIIDVHWQGNRKKAYELGYDTADRSFGKFYKLFLRLGNPNLIAARSSSLFQTIHRPGNCAVLKNEKGDIEFEITGFQEPYEIIFQRMIGYYVRASELTGAKNVRGDLKNVSGDWKTVRLSIKHD